MDLDAEDPLLRPGDVPIDPGITLDNVETKKNEELKKWLRLRGCHVGGLRSELIKRIKDHILRGKGDRIDPKADGGRWYTAKRKQTIEGVGRSSGEPILPVGTTTWKPFPSVRIPENFTEDKVKEYFQRLPRVTFAYHTGVLVALQSDDESGAATRPPIGVSGQPVGVDEALRTLHSESDSDCEDSTDEAEASEARTSSFFHLVKRAVLNCLPRGKRYLRSGHVLSVLDHLREPHYFLKGFVQASMEQEVRTVTVTLVKATGDVCTASCSCKAQALKRCAHIAAVMHLVLKHISTSGTEAVTTTGRPCYWIVKPLGRNPDFVTNKKEYRGNPDRFQRRVSFNPMPTAYRDTDQIRVFRSLLERDATTCLFWLQIKPTSNEAESTTELDSSEAEATNTDELVKKCSKFLWTMNQLRKEHSEPFELEGTFGQRDSPEWRKARAVRCTASNCKTLLGLSKESAIIRHIRNNMWMLDRYQSEAMLYGIAHEPEALEEYFRKIKKDDEDADLLQCGLWINPKNPQLACSPDGILRSSRHGRVLVEVKCLTQPEVDPNHFEAMPPEKLRATYLARLPDKKVTLKKTHAYYYQVQMSLDILELPMAHFFVWSESEVLSRSR